MSRKKGTGWMTKSNRKSSEQQLQSNQNDLLHTGLVFRYSVIACYPEAGSAASGC